MIDERDELRIDVAELVGRDEPSAITFDFWLLLAILLLMGVVVEGIAVVELVDADSPVDMVAISLNDDEEAILRRELAAVARSLCCNNFWKKALSVVFLCWADDDNVALLAA